MGYWYSPPPPQPAAVHVPPNAAATTNIPPNPIGPGSQFNAIRATWPQESWPAQTGDTVAGPITPVVPPSRSALGPLSLAMSALINSTWPREQWAAQSAGVSASLLAPVIVPVIFPSPLRTLAANLRATWQPESWYAQSESGIASGLAQGQVPPLYTPNWYGDTLLMLVGTWPREDWRAQTGARYAAWIPPPVTAIPTVIRHPEILQWTPETWSAQAGTRNASILGAPPSSPPYVNAALRAALRASWLPESWPAQTFPDIIAGTPPLTPPLPRPPSQFPISQWPPEFWGPQSGTRDAAIFANSQILTFMPWVVGEFQGDAVNQLEALFNAAITIQYVFSGAPPEIVVFQSIPVGTLVFPGEAVTLEVSLGRHHGPRPTPIIESILVSNIPVVVSILPPNKKVIQ